MPVHKKKEADFSIKFRHWIRANPVKFNFCPEMKDTRGKSYFPFSEYKEHQADYAMSLKYSEKGILMRNQGGNGEPDYTYYYKQPTCLVINYTDKGFVIIEFETFLEEKKRTKAKSLSWKRACDIAIIDVHY